MPKKPLKRPAVRKPRKANKQPEQAASIRKSKSDAARALRALQARTAIASIMREPPTIDWNDGILKSPRRTGAQQATNRLPNTGPMINVNILPDAMYGKLEANWVGVDSNYRTGPSALRIPNPSIELTDETGNTSVQLRKGREKFVHLGEYEGQAGIWVGASDELPGRVVVRAGDQEGRIILDSLDSSISVRAPGGDIRARLFPTEQGCALQMYDPAGVSFAYLGTFDGFGGLALGSGGLPGRIELFNGDFQPEIVLDADSGDIMLMNADCAEEFDVSDSTVEPGTVLVLGEEPGRLRASDCAYDTRVAGVISGAGGYRPGIVLDRKVRQKERRPVALTGKVFCRVEANSAPIRPGTLLTTSDEPGCAMAATDRERAFGAVMGKALAGLDRGCGLIPILVALQ